MPEDQKRWTAELLLERSRAYQESQPILAAAELGLFEALGDAARTAEDLAGALGTDARATGMLLDALTALGLLRKEASRYALQPALVPLLSGEGDASVLSMVCHQVTCAHRWDALAEVVRSGSSGGTQRRAPLTGDTQRAFIEAMHVLGRDVAAGIVAELVPGRFRRALDVGGASGTYTIALLRAVAEMRVTLFDLPPVIEMARERLGSAGLLDRVDLVTGDFYEDPLPGGHDLVLLSAIIHQNGPAQNRDLYAKCRAALEPGGMLVIRDILMDDTHTRPAGGALFALNMLVATEAGDSYSFAEIRGDLEASGFEDVEILREGEWMDSLVAARRPE